MVVFVPIPSCFNNCSFVVLSEIWERYASSFTLFPQDCFGNSGGRILKLDLWLQNQATQLLIQNIIPCKHLYILDFGMHFVVLVENFC